MLRAFGDGTPTKVTYYHRIDQDGNIRGTNTSIDDDLHRVHAAYLKIHNFEIKVSSSFQFEHQTDSALVKQSGEAFTYPGFEPKIGDRFIMELDTGKFGMLELNEQPVRMSIRAQSYWRISFILTDWIDDEFMAPIEAAVRKEGWFDKLRFLTEPGALLVKEEVILMQKAKTAATQMINYYTSKFFERLIYNTYMRPDKLFDPYVIDFMRRICSYEEMHGLPEQFVSDAPGMDISWWRWLLNPAVVPKQVVPKGWRIKYYRVGSKCTRVNALLNQPYLMLIVSGDDSAWGSVEDGYGTSSKHKHKCMYPDRWPPNDYYLNEPGDTDLDEEGGGVVAPNTPQGYLSDFILSGTGEDDPFAVVVNTYLERQVIIPDKLIAAFDQVYSMSDGAQFYQFPVLIFLAKKCIENIHGIVGAPSIRI